MLRSVTVKALLCLAFVVTAAVLLVGGVALLTVITRVEALRGDQTLQVFRAEAAAYYAARDTFEGFMPSAVDGASSVLVDSAGQVVSGGGNYQIGARLSSQQIAAGLPVMVGGNRVGTVLLTDDALSPNATTQAFVLSVTGYLLLTMVVVIVLALILGSWLLQRLLRPIDVLTAAAAEVREAGHTPRPIQLATDDQFADIALAINALALQLERDLHQRRLMTANIAHDLRTPLSVISGYLETMIDGMIEPSPERLQTMFAEAEHLRQLIEDFRTVTLSETGELKLLIRPVEPAALLRQIASAFQPLAETQGISIQLQLAADLPTTTMDRERMAQVLSNLVSNALRHTNAGGYITLSAYEESGLHLVVADTGSGIPADQLPHIFERAYQAEQGYSGASGLGLSIARLIVEAHEGSIRADSTLGVGTVMTITLPSGFHHPITASDGSRSQRKLG